MKTLFSWMMVLAIGLGPSLARAQTRPEMLDYEAYVPGQMSGFATMVIRLVDDQHDQTLFEETINVMISDFRFRGRLNSYVDGGIPALVTTERSLSIEYARASSPNVVIGTIPLSAPAYAMTLSPNAEVVAPNTFLAGITITGSARTLVASSTGSGAALRGDATSATGSTAGVEGRSNAATGAGGHFINTSTGDLIQARATEGGPKRFHVKDTGDAYQGGSAIPEFGPRGATGDVGAMGEKGPRGDPGSKGPTGNPGSFRSFGVATSASTCAGICKGQAVLKSSAATGANGCQLQSDQGAIYNLSGGMCCVCGM